MSKKNIQDSKSIEFPDQKIVPINMEKRVQKAFLEYSMSVIISRALPDVRDGMKPGQRRILYAMYEDNLTHANPFRKSATTVGNVLGRYHPHGDAAVYGTMVRMAQDFSLRYPLIEGHGNFGSVDGDGAAAYRYTEARLSRIADEMTRDMEKDVVDFNPNFDNRRREPAILPSRFPNILVNGSVGIAVGMATNIPPHNLREVVEGTLYLMDNPDATVNDLMQYIKGPDFPTAATIYGTAGIRQAYATGRGRVMVRAKAQVEEDEHRIIVTEIPYQVNKSMLTESIADLVKEKRVDGITDVRDESGKQGMRIVIEYRRDANGQVILNQLYKYTQLQDTCAMNMLALSGGQPKIMGLKEILQNYVDFQEDIIVRRTTFELNKALKEAHILEGYKVAIDNLDIVINIIRSSPDIPTAKTNLMARFSGDNKSEGELDLEAFAAADSYTLSEEQAQAIVSMTLGRLSGLERKKIEDRLVEIVGEVEKLRAILADNAKVRAIVREEMTEIARKYGDDRKTEIAESHDEIELEDLIERHRCVITLTHGGYIKRQRADNYTAQRRGGKGKLAMGTKEEDYTERVIVANSHSLLLFFTNLGRVHATKAYRIPESSRTAKGTNAVNLMELSEGEKVTTIIEVEHFADEDYLVMVTKLGVIKRTPMSEYVYQRRGGKIAINLDEGDELIFIARTAGVSDIIIATRNGLGARFAEERVSVVGRTARGVRGIKLKAGDYVVGAALIENNDEWQSENKLIMICENGYGKRSECSDFGSKGRGNQGMICQNVTEKTGSLCGIGTVAAGDDLMLITDTGTIIRTSADDIPVYSRTATGVIVMRTNDDAKIVNFAVASRREDEEAEAAALLGDEGLEDADIMPDDEDFDGEDDDEAEIDALSGDDGEDDDE